MNTITIADVAFVMHKTPTWVRKGLQDKILPFGVAVKIRNRYSYHIAPRKFAQYMGISAMDLETLIMQREKCD